MGRPRKRGRRDLPAGLYQDAGGFKVRHPLTGKWVRLGKDKAGALRVHGQLSARWQGEVVEAKAQALIQRLEAAGAQGALFTDFARYYRTEVLPTALGRNQKPLASHTRGDYERMLRNSIETAEELQVSMGMLDATALRTYLAQWLDNPAMYNYRLALLSRVCRRAVDEGKLDRNPCRDIERRGTAKRDAYIEDAHYAAIGEQLASDWERALVDWIYLLSQNPTDCLRVREEQVTVHQPPRRDEDGTLVYADIEIARGKTGEVVVIGMTADLWEVYQYFLELKRAQQILSPHVTVYGTAFRRPLIGRPVSTEYVSRRWARAAVAAGFPAGHYQLRDLRPKGLTDEARIEGKATDKGAHRTEAMKQHYVRVTLPKRVRANIRRIRG